MSAEPLNSRVALKYLGIPKKDFENYYKFSKEIKSRKRKGSYFFKKEELDRWKKLRESRTVHLTREEYKTCFYFAILMAYSKASAFGSGQRGVRNEMEQANNWIGGILAEVGLQKFLKEKFNCNIVLDLEPHPERITPQDIVEVDGRPPKIGVAMKSTSVKNCFLLIPPREWEEDLRKSDAYVLARVGLPSDHLFQIISDHLFFKDAREKINEKFAEQEDAIAILEEGKNKIENEILELGEESKKVTKTVKDKAEAATQRQEIRLKQVIKQEIIKKMERDIKKITVYNKTMDSLPEKIPIWICGYSDHGEIKKKRKVPGQEFEPKKGKDGKIKKGTGYKYVKSVSGMKNSDDDWKNFVGRLRNG